MEKDLQIKDKIKDRYSKITISGNSDSCCMPSSSSKCCNTEEEEVVVGDTDYNVFSSAKSIGYNPTELEAIPQSSIYGVGCGNPTNQICSFK
jgi:arsenite methyltransferase